VPLFCVYFGSFCFNISKISENCRVTREVDRVLHGAESINFGSYSEGELAILESEISKLTIGFGNRLKL